MRAHCSACASLAAICLTLALVTQGCSGEMPAADASAPGTEAAPAAGGGHRFEVELLPMRRGPGHLLRTDTATGQAWIMGTMQAPRWQPTAEGADGVPTPDGTVAGRYEILAAAQTRGSPTLVRVDHVTGRIWRKGSTSPGPWVAVPNPDPGVTEPDPDWEPVPEPLVNQLPIAPPPGAGSKARPPAPPKAPKAP